MAPVVLWIDEIEKGLSSGGSAADGGVSSRLLGSFLTWLQERSHGVFVVATANDVTALPPELLRKGRFDETFFVDLPGLEARAQILRLHLESRGRDPDLFDLGLLAEISDGFSGAELEQAIVAGLYTAFAEGRELDGEILRAEIDRAVPLSVMLAERIDALREWARGRTVPAA
jgi:SpoVK/Ycf46/Vps4 family AAA+-type ATPase